MHPTTLKTMPQTPTRPRSTLLAIVLLWLAFYASIALFHPPLLDDADSVHPEVAREMLLRHDYVTLYANGIRYLEKAPLFYWLMAASMRLSMLFGATSPRALAAAARIPLALSMLGLALTAEALARRMFGSLEQPERSPRAGLYTALILLSSFGMFLFTRMLIPDAMVCLWITLSMYALWRTEELEWISSTQGVYPQPSSTATTQVPRGFSLGSHTAQTNEGLQPMGYASSSSRHRSLCYLFALACALNVLTKGLIGIVFPVGIAVLYYLATRGLRGTLTRLKQLHPLSSIALFLVIATPWHILAGLANPTQGHPTSFHFIWNAHGFAGHWIVPLPTDGNVRGWFWFYFMNEHVLRYLNLRVPHDYDTAPLWLFWGLCLLWLMPWSAFLFKAAAWATPLRNSDWRTRIRTKTLVPEQRSLLLLSIWAAFVLLFFALSSRQEYYVLPALPALAILIAGWLALSSQTTHYEITTRSATATHEVSSRPESALFADVAESGVPSERSRLVGVQRPAVGTDRGALRCLYTPLTLGALIFFASLYFLLHTPAPSPNTDLASLLTQNPSDYALSLGHFMDLTGPSIALFRAPLLIAACALFLGPLCALALRLRNKPHPANLALASGSFGFLISVLWGLTIFSPVLTSAHLANAIRPQLQPQDLVCIHGEYEAGSTLGFYLQRTNIHILEGRSSNLWYGSFFTDAPKIFETPASIAQKWNGKQRIFMWQSLTDPPNQLPRLPGPVYILVKNGGKEIVSNQPNH
ncbi:phospholipid carrier-dependent glycosyltransferase [Granulicella sp. 5B5]|uniref:ArnT family glycosyltransferase n=1 Tax=Granulicella sp. 5B5 TaxID=1617967 RepID=UPI0015F3B2D4|nr:phospholipid carrier-dependent glycosyltransferase [Granulicella sp. 5B5]